MKKFISLMILVVSISSGHAVDSSQAHNCDESISGKAASLLAEAIYYNDATQANFIAYFNEAGTMLNLKQVFIDAEGSVECSVNLISDNPWTVGNLEKSFCCVQK